MELIRNINEYRANQTQGMINIYTFMVLCTCLVVASYVASLQLVVASK